MKPLLKWVGGKRWLAPHLHAYYTRQGWGERVVYYEPFAGGAAVGLEIEHPQNVFGDLNGELMNCYRVLARHGELHPGFVLDPHFQHTEADYQHNRSLYNQLRRQGTRSHQSDDWLMGTLFYYLNQSGFHGLYRVNRGGEFNVPFGHDSKPSYEEEFARFSDLFLASAFLHGHYALHTEIGHRDFMYLDPPYAEGFVDYTSKGFTTKDTEHLFEWVTTRPCPVIISTANSIGIRKYLAERSEFEVLQVEGPRHFNPKSTHRAGELLIFYNCKPDEPLYALQTPRYPVPVTREGIGHETNTYTRTPSV